MKFNPWRDEVNGIVNPSCFSTEAKEFADKIEVEGRKKRKDGTYEKGKDGKYVYEKNKRTQIRKFYDEIINLNQLIKNKKKNWQEVEPLLHMTIAKSVYAEGRNLISSGFVEFMKYWVDFSKSEKHLNIFADFFECFMGFYRAIGPN